jgi:hypothetical protein
MVLSGFCAGEFQFTSLSLFLQVNSCRQRSLRGCILSRGVRAAVPQSRVAIKRKRELR